MKDTREDFCPACVTLPLAFAGAGTAYNSNRFKKITIFITVVSILLTIYFIYIKTCSSCKFK